MRARPERRSRSFLRTAPLENAQGRRYFVVEGDERIESLLVCSPVSLRGQYLQDLVRRPDALRGCNELNMVTAMAVFQREGLEFVTGGIVPFYDPNRPRCAQRPQDGGVLGQVIGYFDHLFRFSGLQQFRAKFVPSRVADMYALLWPGVLTPGLVRDLCGLLGGHRPHYSYAFGLVCRVGSGAPEFMLLPAGCAVPAGGLFRCPAVPGEGLPL